jgi:hypothetical protein
VIGRRRRGQPQQPGDHPRDLLLVRAAVAADGPLHLLRRVRARWDTALSGGEEHHPARLPDGKRGAGVGAEVQLLDRDRVRPVDIEQFAHARVDVREPAFERDSRQRPDHTVLERAQPRARALHQAIARAGRPGVDSQYHHGDIILGRLSDTFRAGGR